MWSAWPETVDVYLGRGLAMAQRAGQSTVRVEHAPTAPLGKLLDALASQLKHGEGEKPRWKHRLRVMLSASICPPIQVPVPPGLKGAREYGELARATAASSAGLQIEQLACTWDETHWGVTAALSRPLIEALHTWAGQCHARIASLQPLWSVASEQTRNLEVGRARGLWLLEPDRQTLLVVGEQGHLRAHSASRVSGSDAAEMRRWLLSTSVPEEKLQKLEFTPDVVNGPAAGPSLWKGHWVMS